MKIAIILLFASICAWSKPVILLGYFDPFDKAPFNNSEKVAKLLLEKNRNHPDFELKLCALKTAFDKSFYQLEDCFKELPEAPKMVLGLGESNCSLKIETMARNFDKTKGPDNDGVERNAIISKDAPSEIGLTYPLAKMYCALGTKERKDVQVSNSAGSFVCNNLAFQFSKDYPEVSFGFIHVPSHDCRGIEGKTQVAVKNLELMLAAAAKNDTIERLLTKKKELVMKRASVKGNECLSDFYNRTKGVDEKNFWQSLTRE